MLCSKILAFFACTLLVVFHSGVVRAAKKDIFQAINSDDEEGLKNMLNDEAGRSVLNKQGPGKQTPLMASVLGGKTWAVKILLEHGADVTIGEGQGYTPMHGAGFQGRAEIAEILMDHGLNPNDEHQDGFTPLHRACWGKEKRHTDTVLVLLKRGVDPESRSKFDRKTCAEMTSNAATKKLLKRFKENYGEL